ncbi:hypothetical protein DKM44_07395 [Deinococcus irradiatisoli]|uniref:Uncharacterized protein n=1 Tax=Deinococcus irradiatisoli TaxID=2202254 RepID=A0A2Z3JD20_9DEIO|nr:hypothetical protein [Deinococcus irradiatisoli]AWN23073.1 hypothetical protein DKM44_07395 [Deinococcus irradiatisoli]
MNTLTQLTPLYVAVLLAAALMWLWQVAQAARRSLWPRLGVLMPLGLASLLAAPLLDVPALFGMGAAFVLIAAYWPALRLRRPPGRWARREAWLIFAAALLWAVGAVLGALPARTPFNDTQWILASGLTLYAAARLLSVLLYPRRRPATARRVPDPFLRRWQGTLIPDLPDLELTLDVNAARLLNTSGRTLHLAGWSPASSNAWLRARSAAGAPLSTLNAGETAYLTPWSPLDAGHSSGLRLWYVRDGEDATYLFRADWTGSWARPGEAAPERVLN